MTHHRLHAHLYHELVLIQTGRYRSQVQAEEHIAVPGDILLYTARTGHEEWVEDNQPVTNLTCGFHYDEFGRDEPIIRHDKDGKVQQLLTQLTILHFRDRIRGTSDLHEHEGRALMADLIVELGRLKPQGSFSLVEKAKAYIRANLAQPINVDDVAATVGLSRCHFSRVYRAATGQTPWHDIQRLRMEEARRLIINTRLPLHKIAPLVGIANEYHLSRLLKELLGVGVRDLRGER